MLRRAAALALSLSACGGPGEDSSHEVLLRVSATAGLTELVAGPAIGGSTAAAIELIYDLPALHVELVKAEGTRAVFRRKSDAAYSTEELAARVRFDGLVSARVLDRDRFEAVFSDEESASIAVDPSTPIFDVGPFAPESVEKGHVRLRRRGDSAIEVIDILEMSHSDEWRRLMARELDAIPLAASIYRDQFEGMESVRVLGVPPTYVAALYFNVRDTEFANVDTRRRIASTLQRDAIARVVCGDPGCAASSPSRAVTGAGLPGRLRLLVVREETFLLTAEILRHQFHQVGIQVDIEPVASGEGAARMLRGEYQVALSPQPKGATRFQYYLSPPAPGGPSLTGFSDSSYDAAVGRGDLATAQQILDRDVPVTPLLEPQSFAAIDARFCGDVTPSVTSWRWMADLYPCVEEAAP